MKKITLCKLIVVLQLITNMGHAYDRPPILDIFVVFGKRNETIDSILTEALNTEKTTWKRTRAPLTDEFERWAAYSPINGQKIEFQFHELHYSKHPTIRSISDIVSNDEKERAPLSKQTATLHEGNGKITIKRLIPKTNIFSKDEKTTAFELLTYEGHRTGKENSAPNLFGETVSETSMDNTPEIITDTPREVLFKWVIDLGDGEFRTYSYWTKDREISLDEKTYLVELFKYMEEQIKHVPL